jgi:translocation and assembly module TamB
MKLTAKGTLTDSAVMGGRVPHLAFDGFVSDDTASVKASGSFEGFDPAAVSGKPSLKGHVGGELDVDATVAGVSKGLTVDNVRASAKVTLQSSEVGGFAIARANVDGDYYESTGEIRAFEITGRDLNVDGSGTIALNETGQSRLKLHAESSRLETVGQLVKKPLAGIARVDANITGNRRELQAAGTLSGDGVKYGSNGALTLSTNFTAKLAELDFERAVATTDTHATFVTIGGQNVNDVQARVEYASRQVNFDVTATEPQRSLVSGGSLVLHPDHQEVHLRQLTARSQGVTWQTAPGTQPSLQYRNDSFTLNDFSLVSEGNQRIAAAGTFGQPGGQLKISVENAELASINTMLLQPPRFSGRIDGSATISGTRAAPQIDGQFKVSQGGFKDFKYESFTGTVSYTGRGVNVDTRLQQNPNNWLTAKGYVPLAAMRMPSENPSHRHVEATGPPEDRFDLHIDSSPIDLGLVQGFTAAVKNVGGTFHVQAAITGAAIDPHPIGEITIRGGAFTLAPTGVKYTNVDGRIDLKPDSVHVGAISVLDSHQNPLTISGDMDFHGTQAAGVQVYASSDDFQVLNNRMGSVRVSTDLRLYGNPGEPHIDGDLTVTSGQINLDPILMATTDSAYATTASGQEPVTGESQNQAPTPSTRFGGLVMNLHLTVPEDVVVKASDLRASGSPVGGAMNVTVNGDIRATKQPGATLRLVGSINTVRGFYNFQGRRFTILRDGTVRFEGLEEINPTLNISAERVIQAVTARVNIRGTMAKPQVLLSSTPPLDQADILSLIVFNQPLNSVGEGQQLSLSQRAEDLATGVVAGELAKSIGNALHLDEFQINTTNASGSSSPEITIGQQLGSNLYVRVEQGIGDQSQTNVVLEYEITRWLRLRTNYLDTANSQQQLFERMQGSGIDLLFFFSY